jgi:hypothetical protein
MKLLNLFKRKQTPVEWWGYKAIDGTYHAFKLVDIRDYYLVKQSDYCLIPVAPFMALNKQTALQTIKDTTDEKVTHTHKDTLLTA